MGSTAPPAPRNSAKTHVSLLNLASDFPAFTAIRGCKAHPRETAPPPAPLPDLTGMGPGALGPSYPLCIALAPPRIIFLICTCCLGDPNMGLEPHQK